MNSFIEWLWDYFPEADDTLYQHDTLFTPVLEGDMATTQATCVHVSALGFLKGCSLKPAPGNKICWDLTEQILLDGFTSGQQPLQVFQPESAAHLGVATPWTSEGGALQAHSLGYVKGAGVVGKVSLWLDL